MNFADGLSGRELVLLRAFPVQKHLCWEDWEDVMPSSSLCHGAQIGICLEHVPVDRYVEDG